jgi:hypothetical protein
MRDFLQRNITLLSTVLGGSFVIAFLLFTLLLAAKEQRDALEKTDQPIAGFVDLPGPKNAISDRSRKEINYMLSDNPHVVGGYVAKIHYEKTENPIFYYFTKDPIMHTLWKNYDLMQKSGKGFSSNELDAARAKSMANTEEAKTGVIGCQPLEDTNIGRLAPGIETKVKGVCRATIPPFDEKVNLSLVVLIDLDGLDLNDPAIIELQRVLLQLQIDIFNRDFKGRETWAQP